MVAPCRLTLGYADEAGRWHVCVSFHPSFGDALLALPGPERHPWIPLRLTVLPPLLPATARRVFAVGQLWGRKPSEEDSS